jgi:hypothetical protein
MAHFAKLNEENVVVDIIVVSNEDINDLPFPESEPVGITFLTPWNEDGFTWKQTSYNSNFRKNYAVIDGTYDPVRDAFIPPKMYESWILNEETCVYDPPVPIPLDAIRPVVWNESTLSWDLIPE